MFSMSLQRRIAVVFAGLLVLVMGFVLALVHTSSERIVGVEAQRELAIGAHVFQRLLEQNQRQLETAATVLSGDFAFREAIATQDAPTVRSVIGNHARRIHAQVMMVAGTDGKLVASTEPGAAPGMPFPFPGLISAADSNGRSAGLRQLRDGYLYQVVVVPILAPTRIAWVLMGFRVDDRWASDLASLSGLAVHVIRSGPDTTPALLATSLASTRHPDFAHALFSGGDVIDLGDTLYRSTRLPLGGDIQAVLQLPVAQVRQQHAEGRAC